MELGNYSEQVPIVFLRMLIPGHRQQGSLRDYFGDNRLTNAHNELLTSLVNIGITGTIFYFGFFLSSMIRCLKEAGKKQYLLIPAGCIFCYLIHNTVSFAQVLNLPYIFVIVAMGERMLRGDNSESA